MSLFELHVKAFVRGFSVKSSERYTTKLHWLAHHSGRQEILTKVQFVHFQTLDTSSTASLGDVS
jgi:hypothetical protein